MVILLFSQFGVGRLGLRLPQPGTFVGKGTAVEQKWHVQRVTQEVVIICSHQQPPPQTQTFVLCFMVCWLWRRLHRFGDTAAAAAVVTFVGSADW